MDFRLSPLAFFVAGMIGAALAASVQLYYRVLEYTPPIAAAVLASQLLAHYARRITGNEALCRNGWMSVFGNAWDAGWALAEHLLTRRR